MRRRELLHGLGATALSLASGCGRPGRGERGIGKSDWHLGINPLQGVDEFGNQREAKLCIPSSYTGDSPVPLVIGFHGSGGDSDKMMRAYKWGQTCEQHGFIGLFPSMLNHAEDNGRPVDPAQLEQDWSIGLVAKTARHLNIDLSRVWLAGFSMGGRRAYRLAAIHSDTVAAIAVHSAQMGYRNREGTDDQWHPEVSQPESVSILHIHGEADTRVPMDGQRPDLRDSEAIAMPTQEGLEVWAQHMGCTEDPAFKPPPRCPKGVWGRHWMARSGHSVTGLFVPGLGHTWSGLWANEVMMGFLKRTPPRS